MEIGKGLPGVTRCDDYHDLMGLPEDHPDYVHRWIFPDVYYAGTQRLFERLGARVWGSRRGEELELHRVESKEFLRSLGIAIGEYEVVQGITALRDFINTHPGWWVKISLTRGDSETFQAVNYRFIEAHLDELEHILGPENEDKEFVCEAPIDDAVEIAYDGFTVDGKTPDLALVGLEVKGMAYVGKFVTKAETPPQLLDVNERLAPTLAKYHYRNWLAMESRITKDGTAYVVDPCARWRASPPGEGIQLAYTNLPDILAEGSEGRVVEPVPAGQWLVELIMHSDYAEHHELCIQFPSSTARTSRSKTSPFATGSITSSRRTSSPWAPSSPAGTICSRPSTKPKRSPGR